jgi:hypothetical protein
MEAYFDNKANVLTASIRTSHDQSEMYRLKSTFGFMGRRITVMREVPPADVVAEAKLKAQKKKDPLAKEPEPKVVGAIHWQEKLIEVHGVKKKWKELKRTEGSGFLGLKR